MKHTRKFILFVAVLLATTGCAESKQKTKPSASIAPTSSTHFEGIGSVTLHQGQPCAPQIMFDFHAGFGETVELAAGFKDSRTLTEAARRRTRLRVSGTWRRTTAGCRFVEVTGVQK